MEQFLPLGTELNNGRYQITEMLKQGGFGIVYKANCQNNLHDTVAIKEFYMADFCERKEDSVIYVTSAYKEKYEELKQRFKEEAKKIHKLSHTHIIRVIDFFEENNTVYIVMEYIEGGSLNDKIRKEGILSVDVALNYIQEVGKALTYMHENTMIHLDIKPPNIMIGQNGKAKMIDFGLTKQYANFETETLSKSTLTGYTNGFAPIEQYDYSRKKFLPASDVYALGATFYYCITKTIPPASPKRSSGDDELIRASHINPFVNKKTDAVIEKAMAIRPVDRYQTVSAFLVDLEKACKGKKFTLSASVSSSDKRTKSIESQPPLSLPKESGRPIEEIETLIEPEENVSEITSNSPLPWYRKYKFLITATVIVVLCGIFITGRLLTVQAPLEVIMTSQEETDWKMAEEENTIQSYQQYISLYPSGQYTEEATLRIQNSEEEQAWITATQSNTLQSYRNYLSAYPQGQYSVIAKNNITELTPVTPQIPTRQEEMITQDREETIALGENTSREEERRQREEAERTERERREAEQRRLVEEQRQNEQDIQNRVAGAFGPGNTEEGSQGTGTTGTGNEGSPFGNSDTGLNEGVGGFDGSFNLVGRSIRGGGLPRPEDRIAEAGTIVVNITIDPRGDVIRAEIGRGTNIDNAVMRNGALDAAKRAKFNSIQGESLQSGTITYRYRTL